MRWALTPQINRACAAATGAWPARMAGGPAVPWGHQGRALRKRAWIENRPADSVWPDAGAGLLSQKELLKLASWPATVTCKHGPVGREFGRGMGRSGFRGARGASRPPPRATEQT